MTAAVFHGNGAEMRNIADGDAALVFTGPPYYPASVEERLREPVSRQTHLGEVARDVVAFAWSLRPVFDEIRRVLAKDGVLIVQTKDIRYGSYLIPVSSLHRQMAESIALSMVTRILWEPLFQQASQRLRVSLRPGMAFRVREVEEFLVFADPTRASDPHTAPEGLPSDEMSDCLSPVWRLRGAGGRRHPHQSPPDVVRRLVSLYSRPGDLVVDPFAGGGGILEVAARLNRRVAGYEIDPMWAESAARVVERAIDQQVR